jgi:hypothetical protein
MAEPKFCPQCYMKTCDCGVKYITAGKAAPKLIALHPGWGDTKIASEYGIGHMTVRRARLPNGKPEKREGKDGKNYPVDKIKNRKPKPIKQAKAEEVIELKVKNGEKYTTAEVASETGVSVDTVERAQNVVAARIEERERLISTPPEQEVKPEDLSKTAQEKLAAAIRQHQAKLEMEFKPRVKAEVQRLMREMVEPRLREREEDAERVVKARKGVFSQQQYNSILRCLHPDTTPTTEQKTEAFRLMQEKRVALLSEKEDPKLGSYLPLPTVEEFMKLHGKHQK